MAEIILDGFEEVEELFNNMVLDVADKRKAIRAGISVIAEGLEKDTPKGETGRLSKIKVTVRENELSTEGIAKSNAFYDLFQEFGTSRQKANVGYFERSVDNNKDEATEKVSKIIFAKMR